MWQVPLLLGCCMYLKDCSLTVVTYSIICCYSNKAFLIIEPPNTTWWQRCSLLSRSKSIPRQRSSPSALGSFCSDGEALSLYFKTPKFYPSTAGRRSSITLLQDAEVLCGTAKFYPSTAGRRSSTSLLRKAEVLLLHCGTVKPYLPTPGQLLYYTERWQQK